MLFSLFFFLILSFQCAIAQDYFSLCHNAFTFGTSIPFKGTPDKPIFVPECAPDTLYSWQKSSRINLDNFSKSPLINGIFLYTWRTPIGTFGYGDVQLRLKLKKNVKFRWVKTGDQACPKADQENTVYVHAYPFGVFIASAVDYLLCSKGPVESWSAGSLGAFFEAKNELDFISMRPYEYPQPYDSYGIGFLRTKPVPRSVFYPDNPYFMSWDNDLGHDWSEKGLLKKIENLKIKKFGFQNRIYCHQNEHCDLQNHFQSHETNYFSLTKKQSQQLLEKSP